MKTKNGTDFAGKEFAIERWRAPVCLHVIRWVKYVAKQQKISSSKAGKRLLIGWDDRRGRKGTNGKLASKYEQFNIVTVVLVASSFIVVFFFLFFFCLLFIFKLRRGAVINPASRPYRSWPSNRGSCDLNRMTVRPIREATSRDWASIRKRLEERCCTLRSAFSAMQSSNEWHSQ